MLFTAGETIRIRVPPNLAKLLAEQERGILDDVQQKLGVDLEIIPDETLKPEEYEILSSIEIPRDDRVISRRSEDRVLAKVIVKTNCSEDLDAIETGLGMNPASRRFRGQHAIPSFLGPGDRQPGPPLSGDFIRV